MAKNAAAGAGGLAPYIVVKDARAAIDFYTGAFGATELFRLVDPQSDKIGHAELRVGKGILMLADEYPDFGAVAPQTLGGTTVKLHLDVPDAAAVLASALKLGATELRKLELQFHDCRQALVADPFGYGWFISEKVEEVAPAKMQQRWDDMAKV